MASNADTPRHTGRATDAWSALADRSRAILATRPVDDQDGAAIGPSREGRTIHAHRFGRGERRVSLLGGCHADEPVGPRLLRHLCAYLRDLSPHDPLIEDLNWWIVPHINPDGAARNRSWYHDDSSVIDLPAYLEHVVREPPGDDIEFGFPRDRQDRGARPENAAVYAWWHTAAGPFTLHASLHGMAFAAGPWFLIEEAWRDRMGRLEQRCRDAVYTLGYVLHDVERQGEKGFARLGRGFCTRPDSRHMRRHFVLRRDPETAALFRPSSMETIRALGGDALTLVSEMPLFLTPGVGEDLGPPDPAAVAWQERIETWRAALREGQAAAAVRDAAARAGLRAMPIRDQMALQWILIAAGLEETGAV